MTEKKKFSEKLFTIVSTHPKNRLLHSISKTAIVSISLSDKNIKYWKINCKNIRLRLKISIKNDFLLNGFQILA